MIWTEVWLQSTKFLPYLLQPQKIRPPKETSDPSQSRHKKARKTDTEMRKLTLNRAAKHHGSLKHRLKSWNWSWPTNNHAWPRQCDWWYGFDIKLVALIRINLWLLQLSKLVTKLWHGLPTMLKLEAKLT